MNDTNKSAAESTTVALRVEGMTCASCVSRVENALRHVEGTLDASVNLATNSARVVLRNGVTDEALLSALRGAGYGGTVDGDTADFGIAQSTDQVDRERARQRTAFVWAAAGMVVLMAAHRWGGHGWGSHGFQAAVAAALLVGPAGRRIMIGGLRALYHRAPNMDSLVAVGVGTAFVASVVNLLFSGSAPMYFDALGMILFFIAGGKYLESRARHEAGRSVAALAARVPRVATCLRDGAWVEVKVNALLRGDRVRVVPDGVIPVDGRVVAGAAAVDESMITGESVPQRRAEDDPVLGGTLVREGTIEVHATGVGRETAIGRLVTAVEQAQAGKTHMQRIADQVAGVFVPVVMVVAALTVVAWLVFADAEAPSGGWGWALSCGVAVLVIACPCAMGLATPMAVLVAGGKAALAGILVRSPAALEAAGRARVILFDKTGTLTTGQPVVEEIYDEPKGPVTRDERDLLRLTASAEQFSSHPLAKAIVAKARAMEVALIEPSSFETEAGRGVTAQLENRRVQVGSLAFLAAQGVDVAGVQGRAEQMAAAGRTVVGTAVDGTCAGLMGLSDTIRPGAAATVQALLTSGYEVAMITGDGPRTAEAVAAELGIHNVYAQILPEGKMAEVTRLREQGKVVVFVGDGANDAPALAAADVGIVFAAGTDIANQAAAITLVGDDPRAVVTAVRLARRSVRIIKENLFWAFGYNVVMIPLAAIGTIPPGWAAAAMMLSSISVVLNSLRLRRDK